MHLSSLLSILRQRQPWPSVGRQHPPTQATTTIAQSAGYPDSSLLPTTYLIYTQIPRQPLSPGKEAGVSYRNSLMCAPPRREFDKHCASENFELENP
ncbi:hypothetical protein K440DRAFT_31460 [Wilcoxina mikolae CBS 423.85]|nr:hypothetical protein K440DRAFT_31460 [Wilcoxina mikolae CBS 423.85]